MRNTNRCKEVISTDDGYKKEDNKKTKGFSILNTQHSPDE
jgi:hypothetical protein